MKNKWKMNDEVKCKLSQVFFFLRATVFQNDIKMHLRESDPMGNPLQHHQFSVHDLIKDEERLMCC